MRFLVFVWGFVYVFVYRCCGGLVFNIGYMMVWLIYVICKLDFCVLQNVKIYKVKMMNAERGTGVYITRGL